MLYKIFILSILLSKSLFYSFGQECYYDSLSNQFNISIESKKNKVKNSTLDSVYIKVVIRNKDTDSVIQTIRKNQELAWDSQESNCSHVRSYQTTLNLDLPVVDNDFGRLIIADFNFDGLDDFAFSYDASVTSGPIYHFYIQQTDGTFIRQVFLSENMAFFPAIIDTEKKQLITHTHANTYQIGIRTFQFNPETNSWYLLNQIKR
ncbi:MAG: hypothetical protein MI810_23325 [Flavobacteriales bacterium]|nr:hypothetical protein [Flavobacteriales bacterium]